jgi:hypothetical protein
MERSRLRTACFLALLVATGYTHLANASEKTTLRWRFQAGQKFQVCCTRSSESVITGGGRRIEEKTRGIFDEVCNVKSVDGQGTAQVVMTFKRFRFKTESPKGNSDVDSDQPTDKLPTDLAFQAQLMKKVVGLLEVHFTVDSRSHVLAAHANEEAKAWVSVLPGLSERLSEKGIEKTLKQLLPGLPQSPLAVGDTWQDTLEFNRPRGQGSQKVHVKYRYAGPERHGNRTLQKIVTEATLDGFGEGMPPGVTVKVVSQANPGFIYFDSEAGRLTEMETSENRTVEYAATGRTAQEQVTVTSKTEISPVP